MPNGWVPNCTVNLHCMLQRTPRNRWAILSSLQFICFQLQTFEKLKLIQLEKWHDAETEEEREQIELNPKVILHTAVENCTPLLKTKTVRKGAQYYTVS